MNDALPSLLKKYLSLNGISVRSQELEFQFLSHPSYPSLHSITGVLSHFGVDNTALQLPQSIEIVRQLPETFITIIKEEYVLVKKTGNRLEFFFENNKSKIYDEKDFLKIWGGIIIAIDENNTDDNGYGNAKSSKSFNLNWIPFTMLIVLTLGIFLFSSPSIFQSTHFILSTIGLSLSILIINHELGHHSMITDKLCSNSTSNSCDTVLNSKGAILPLGIKLSDACLVYFSSLTVAWVLTFTYGTAGIYLGLASLIAIPITIYSLYYQGVVVKIWCPLCLGIVVVMSLQCASTFLNDAMVLKAINFDLEESFVLGVSILLTITFWLFVKPLLVKERALEKVRIEYFKFKRDFDLFNAILSKNKPINTQIEGLGSQEIVLGNHLADIHLLVITNPSCFFCKQVHSDIENILNKYSEYVKVTIRFHVSVSKKESKAFKVAERLLEIWSTETEQVSHLSLNEVYKKNSNLDEWLIKWGNSAHSFSDVLELQQQWCQLNGIDFTPAIFINERQYPKQYDRSDILFFIEDLIDQARYNKEQDLVA